MLNRGDKIALVCCSDGRGQDRKEETERLVSLLLRIGLEPVLSDYIYERESVFSGSAKERADSLMNFYRDESIKAIFDISGGDIANEILPYLDFSVVGKTDKLFFGYSDLTTIVNAIYAKTGRPSVLWQIRNLLYNFSETQISDFSDTFFEGKDSLYTFDYYFIRGESMEGTVVGGNIGCLLKLAGTEYFPDMNGKILLLESLSGTVAKLTTYLSHLEQLGVFDKIGGILLGTFTKMEQENALPRMEDLVLRFAEDIPVAKTQFIGHKSNSKAIVIGKKIKF